MSETLYIYALRDPETAEPRYVGCTSNPERRLKQYCGQVLANIAQLHWVRDLRSRGLTPEMVVLEETCIDDGWRREAYWIATYRASGHALFNVVTPGPWDPAWRRRHAPPSVATPERSGEVSDE